MSAKRGVDAEKDVFFARSLSQKRLFSARIYNDQNGRFYRGGS